MNAPTTLRPRTLCAWITLLALGYGSPSWAAHRLQAPEIIPLSYYSLGDLAVGDIDGDGIPEIATSGPDRLVHVFQRQAGVWRQVYESTSGLGQVSAAEAWVQIRFTSQPAIAPGVGFYAGQFLFNTFAPGVNIVSLRLSKLGTWSEQVLFGPMTLIENNTCFSSPGLLSAERDPVPQWRIVVPGGDQLGPPMSAYLPRFGQSVPYARMDYNTGGGVYCDQAGSAVPGAEIGDFDGNGSNEIALLRFSSVFVTSTDTATTAGNFDDCWPYQTFAVPTLYGHLQMISGRLNGDAKTDLVVREEDGTLFSLLAIPAIAPHFDFQMTAIPSAAPAPSYSSDLVSADLDGDGDLDLVESFGSPSGVEVLLNDGTGAFTTTFIPLDLIRGGAINVAVGDMDGDGKQDLLLSQPQSSPPRILILPGHGDGTFGLPAGAGLRTLEPSALAITDLDADGVLDVIVGGHDADLSDGAQPMQVFHGQGAGAFDPPSLVAGPFINTFSGIRRIVPFRSVLAQPMGVAAFQVNTEQEAVGNGNGTLQPLSQRYVALTGSITGLDRADMDGDGATDAVRLETLPGGTSSVKIDHGTSTTIPLPGVQSGVRAVDWNSDGKLDLVTLNHDLNQVEIRLMNPSGDFTFPTLLSYPLGAGALSASANRGAAFVVMPFGASGTQRVLMVREVDAVTGHALLQIVENLLPSAGSTYDVGVADGNPMGIDAGDVTGDGVPDVVLGENSIATTESFVTVLRGLAADAFEPNAVFVLPGTTLSDLAVGDVTGDGVGDVLTVTNATLVSAAPAKAGEALAGAGTGQFVLVRSRPVPIRTLDVSEPVISAPRFAMALGPNPAHGGLLHLSYSLPVAAHVTVDLIDLSGRRLRRVLDVDRGAGAHLESFEMADAAGGRPSPGVYFLSLRAGQVSAARRVVVMR